MVRKTIAAVMLAALMVPATASLASAQECDAVQLAKKIISGTARDCFWNPPPPP